jgi:hypothetical protein
MIRSIGDLVLHKSTGRQFHEVLVGVSNELTHLTRAARSMSGIMQRHLLAPSREHHVEDHLFRMQQHRARHQLEVTCAGYIQRLPGSSPASKGHRQLMQGSCI